MALDWDGSNPASAIGSPDFTKPLPFQTILDLLDVDVPDKDNPNEQLMFSIMDAINLQSPLEIDPTEPRSGIWLFPGEPLEATTQLSFTLAVDEITTILNGITSALGRFYTFDLSHDAQPIQIQIQQKMLATLGEEGEPILTRTFSLTVKIHVSHFIFWVNYRPGFVECTMTEDDNFNEGLVTRLSQLGSKLNLDAVVPSFDSILSAKFDLWYLTIGKETGSDTYFEVNLLLTWVRKDNPIILSLSYDSRLKNFIGELIFQKMLPSNSQKLFPAYDPRKELPAALSKDQGSLVLANQVPPSLLITDLFSDAPSFPPGMLTTITTAQVVFRNDSPKQLSVAVSLGSQAAPDQPVPGSFQWNYLNLFGSHTQSTAQASGGLTFEASSSISLIPDDIQKYKKATLFVDLMYDKGSWSLTGRVTDLQFAALGDFFPRQLRQPFLDVLGNLSIRSLEVDYTFTKPSGDSDGSGVKASSFLFTGDILFGEPELTFTYQSVSSSVGPGEKSAAETKGKGDGKARPAEGSPAVWSFVAALGATSPNSDIGQ